MLPFGLSEKLSFKTIKKIGRTHFLVSSEYVGDAPITDRLMEIMAKDYTRMLELPENIQKFHSDETDENAGYIAEKVI